MIRSALPTDADAICQIYNHYIKTSIATFETDPVVPSQMAERVVETLSQYPWLVYEHAGTVLGYAYASGWKGRCAYRFTAESTVYLSPEAVGRGVGRALYEALLEALQGLKVHSVIGGISLPNPASVGLHEALGFEKVAHFKEVGWKFDRWIDTGYWERLLPGWQGDGK